MIKSVDELKSKSEEYIRKAQIEIQLEILKTLKSVEKELKKLSKPKNTVNKKK